MFSLHHMIELTCHFNPVIQKLENIETQLSLANQHPRTLLDNVQYASCMVILN